MQTNESKIAFIRFQGLSFIFPNRDFSMGYARKIKKSLYRLTLCAECLKRPFLSPFRSLVCHTRDLSKRKIDYAKYVAYIRIIGKHLSAPTVSASVSKLQSRHCERSEAIHGNARRAATLDCFVATLLAMTVPFKDGLCQVFDQTVDSRLRGNDATRKRAIPI
jgi:hypothetical protein